MNRAHLRLRLARSLSVLALPLAALLASAPAFADEPPTKEAVKHFQRGVTLFSEADYKAALVEFKRAYALAPNTQVLYNVGQTEFQLQDYAGALTTFERFLAEAPSNDGQRSEVERSVEALRARVGHVTITTIPAGADVAIDDRPVGKTPLDRPVLVSIGRRQVVASMPGRAPVTRYVDVAADDDVNVTVQLPETGGEPTPASPAAGDAKPAGGSAPEPASNGATLRTVGWITTGVLAAGAVTFGILASKESSDLASARNAFPGSSATLSHDSSVATTYAILADSLTAAALVVGGITLFSTITSSSSSSSTSRGAAGGARVMLAPASARFEMTF